ncbi:hypothetical protein PFX98_09670 [Paucibacter sediminis]|uniref:DUF4175 domain-containing protein n=1 Tax=Paucibacter sediminis TaxID=3019553 RepID=A0AA95NPM8_9BURK|nr:hypothetical protein [Paucibacter sp. S2-9]WIT13871.1 hypothetical protein PFX98_09670 [Paucibacter sp. S2-9]
MSTLQKAAPTKNYWFPAKRYGWGWGAPCAWQGWLVIAVFLALLAAGTLLPRAEQAPLLFMAYTAALGVALLAICWLKGEPPRWRWGATNR